MGESYRNIKSYSLKELETLSHDIREQILKSVSKNGGHLSSTLGAVELIVAMHYVFDVEHDPFIFDVSHQAYAHKLLTGRWERFDTLRQFEGVSGFTNPSESQYDYFIAGHSSTSISLAIGAAKSIKLKNEKRIPVALIGDGSMSAGMVYEALNELGDRKYPVVIILNDNEMSISKPIGAISKYLSQAFAGRFFQSVKHQFEKVLAHMPESATYIAKRFEESLKLITPGMLFEELGIDYIGPINGHNLKELIETYKQAKELGRPVIIHAQTTKGKGYKVAEGCLEHWHGVGPFDIKSGEKISSPSSKKSATDIFSEALFDLAQNNKDVVGVTAAMPSGTGMSKLIETFPERFWDVAIAEQHAVTSMAASAKEGLKPFVAIYSTFLQRGFDQIIHDVNLMNLPVSFAIDRAGIVGEDGETHQGIHDIAFLRCASNIVQFAPRDDYSLIEGVKFAYLLDKPCAFRYPRGAFKNPIDYPKSNFSLGKAELLKKGKSEKLFIGYGNGVNKAFATADFFEEEIAILDLRFVNPLDSSMLLSLANEHSHWYVFSDSAKFGGVGSILRDFLHENEIRNVLITTFEYDTSVIAHGKTELIEDMLGVTPEKIAERILSGKNPA